jgi:hypothetical protein
MFPSYQEPVRYHLPISTIFLFMVAFITVSQPFTIFSPLQTQPLPASSLKASASLAGSGTRLRSIDGGGGGDDGDINVPARPEPEDLQLQVFLKFSPLFYFASPAVYGFRVLTFDCRLIFHSSSRPTTYLQSRIFGMMQQLGELDDDGDPNDPSSPSSRSPVAFRPSRLSDTVELPMADDRSGSLF